MKHSEEVKRYCAGEYLADTKRLVSKVRALISQHTFILSQLTGAAISYEERVSHSASGDQLPDGVIRLMELADELDTERVELAERLHEARHVLADVKNPLCAEALQKHYIECMDWADVATSMGYSERRIYQLRDDGVIEVYDLMPEEYRRILPKAVQ